MVPKTKPTQRPTVPPIMPPMINLSLICELSDIFIYVIVELQKVPIIISEFIKEEVQK